MGSIVLKNVGKAYKKYNYPFSRMMEWFSSKIEHHQKKWILRNINLSVESGESVGVIGINGAGKSTLLKIISRTTQQTEGEVYVIGRVAALLELGIGFHHDFTGRQNIYMSGQLLGLNTKEIEGAIPEIEAFAGIGEYIDQPVRIYSSGMQVRLAFAVATAIRPDILIIDEAMAVGDAAFQRKCFRRIEEFREMGTTLLLVSHDVETIKKFCRRALYLRDGEVAALGSASDVCNFYEKSIFGGVTQRAGQLIDSNPKSKNSFDPALKSDCEVSYGDGRAHIESIWLENKFGERVNVFDANDPIYLKYQVFFNQHIAGGVAFAFMIKTKDGIALVGVDTTHDDNISIRQYSMGERITASFRLDNVFAPGNYYLNCGVKDRGESGDNFLHRRVDALIFRVRPDINKYVKSGLINAKVSHSLEFYE